MSSRIPRALGLTLNSDVLRALDRLPWPSPARRDRVIALARALASTPGWPEEAQAVLVVRPDPPECVAVLGHFRDDELPRLRILAAQIEVELPRLRYVDYAEAERDCELLGARLVERLGLRELRSMHFVGIPRGGLIVLGMLSYVLDLPSTALGPPAKGAPVVVVDDCSLTGLRFHQFRADLFALRGEKSVVFAHLYSHPALRAAIEARHSEVVTVAAHDLTDAGPDLYGDGYRDWSTRWSGRTAGAAYWTGRPEPLAFAWSEPEFTLWNEVAQRDEVGWHLVPPDSCLRHRHEADPGRLPLQVQVADGGLVVLSDTTLWADREGEVLLADLRQERVVRLTGASADIWRVLVKCDSMEAAVQSMAATYAAEPDQLRTDLCQFAAELMERGFIVAGPRETVSPR
ncbi:MAG TPA: PqqD family peptide modification chaperone [Longimicrobiaceae bacterium]